jgi:hypothetical protein
LLPERLLNDEKYVIHHTGRHSFVAFPLKRVEVDSLKQTEAVLGENDTYKTSLKRDFRKPNLVNRFSHVKFLHDNIRTNYFLKNDINECFIQEITHMHDSSYLHFPTQTTVCY